MKKLLIALIALGSFTIAANAQTTSPTVKHHQGQNKKHHGKHHRKFKKHHRHHRMAQLNLSDAQKSQAKLYREEYGKKMQALNKNENITVKESRDQKVALRKEQAEKMQSILTPEQKTKMAQFRSEERTKIKEHYAARMDKMKTKLNLSDNQVAQLKTQRESMIAKFKAIKDDKTIDRSAKKEKLVALKTEMKEANKKIFTPEQLQQMQDMRKDRMDKKAAK